MGLSALEQKLLTALNRRVTSEAEALYIMAQTRKLVELTGAKDKYPALNFYCNWALHPTISGSAEGKRIVAIFDKAEAFFTQMRAAKPGQQISQVDLSWAQELEQELDLRKLRDEFQALCNKHNIASKVLDNETEWLRFMKHYAGIIEDVPLTSSNPTLQYVKTVTTKRMQIENYSGINASQPNKRYIMQLMWEWTSSDGIPHSMPMLFIETIVPKSKLHRFWLQFAYYARRLRYHVFDRFRNKS